MGLDSNLRDCGRGGTFLLRDHTCLTPTAPQSRGELAAPRCDAQRALGKTQLLLCLPSPPTASPLCDPTENPGDRGRDPALQQGQVLQREVHEDQLVPQVGWPCPGVPGGRGPAPTPEPSCPPTPGPQREPRKGTAVRGTEGRLPREGGTPGAENIFPVSP